MGSICHGYICIVLYMKCSWCNGFLEINAQLEEGVGSVCTGIVIFHRSMVNWWRKWGQSAMGIYAFCYI